MERPTHQIKRSKICSNASRREREGKGEENQPHQTHLICRTGTSCVQAWAASLMPSSCAFESAWHPPPFLDSIVWIRGLCGFGFWWKLWERFGLVGGTLPLPLSCVLNRGLSCLLSDGYHTEIRHD